MKKFYLFLALGLSIALGVQAETINVGKWATTSTGVETRLVNNNYYTGTLNGVNQPYKLIIPAGATVYLQDLTILGDNSTSKKWAGITCEGDATIILKGNNEIRGFYENYPGIYVAPGYKVTIGGIGTLKVYSNGFGAGIGGGYNIDCGDIIITRGTIKAEGGSRAAGIGGGYQGDLGTIRIAGGDILAKGGYHAPGIGGGEQNEVPGNLIITNDVTRLIAVAGSKCPRSIGQGYNGQAYLSCIVNGESYPGGVTETSYRYPACGKLSNISVDGITRTSADLSWDAPSYIDHFAVMLRKLPSGTYKTISSNLPNSGSGMLIFLEDLTPDQQYEVCIYSYCEEGCYGMNDGIKFTTEPDPCQLPTGLTVSEIGEKTAKVSWNKVGTNQTRWKVGIKKASASAWDYAYATTNSYNLTNLAPETQYNVKVQAACGSVWTDWTSIKTFTTEEEACVAPKNLEVYQLSAHSADISWDPGKLSKWYVHWRKKETTSWIGYRIVSDPFMNIDELDADTEYEVEMYGFCGEDDAQHTNTSSLTFKTPTWNGNLAELDKDITVTDGMHLYGTLDGSKQPYKITIAKNATVTLSGITIKNMSNVAAPGLKCEGDATIVLDATSTEYGYNPTINTIEGIRNNYAAIQVPAGSTLVIHGHGKLIATGGVGAAAIGANAYGSCSHIGIYDGAIVEATGGQYAAAIGGGNSSTSAKVTIWSNVQSVTANAGSGAPYSIGKGYNDNGSSVRVVVDNINYGEGIETNPFVYPIPEGECKDPSNLEVVGEPAANSVQLTWEKGSDDQTGWEIWYRKDGEQYYTSENSEMVHNIPSTLSGLDDATIYYVRVRAFCGSYYGYSNFSDEIMIQTAEKCPRPENLQITEVTHNSAAFVWDSEGSSFEYQYLADDWSAWSDEKALTSQNVQIQGLTPNTKYYFRVRQTCGEDGNSAWVETEFTTDREPCRVPTELVASEITKTSAVLSWTPGEETKWYLYWKKRDATASTYNLEVVTGEPTFKLTNLAPETEYQVSLVAVCGDDYYSGWYNDGNDFIFATEAKCVAPTDLQATDVTTTSATFTWTPKNGETNWIFDIKRTDGTGSSYGTTVSGEPTFTKTGLEAGVEYEVVVKAVCGDDASSEGDLLIFKTEEEIFICNAPTNLQASEIKETSFVLSWTANNEETKWNLIFRKKGASNYVNWTIYQNPYELKDLEPNTIYEINIQALCSAYDWSGWFNEGIDLEVTTAAAEIKCPAPSDLYFSNVTSTSVELDWTPGSDETQWGLEYSVEGEAPFADGKLIDERPYVLEDLEPNTSYQARIVAYCSLEPLEFSAPSNIIQFTTSEATGLFSIGNGKNVTKRIVNGQLFIEFNGKTYNAQGMVVSE